MLNPRVWWISFYERLDLMVFMDVSWGFDGWICGVDFWVALNGFGRLYVMKEF